MKKNVFQGLEENETNLSDINGGYRWSPTTFQYGSHDEELLTEPGDDEYCDRFGGNCIDSDLYAC